MSLSDVFAGLSEVSDYRLQHVCEQEQGGLSVAEYCRQHHISQTTFYKWRRLGRDGPDRPCGKVGVTFTEVGRLEPMEPRWVAEIELSSGTVVRVGHGADVHLLRAVLEVLG